MIYNNRIDELQYELFDTNKALFKTETPYGVIGNLDSTQLNNKVHNKVVDIILKLIHTPHR